jgi:DNA-directed RNA polymerase II subunit RPB1
MTRNCHGTEERSKAPSPESPVYHAVSPVYHAVFPVYSKNVEASVNDDEKTQLPVNSGGDTPSYHPTGPIEHESQDSYGGDDTPGYSPSPSSYRPTSPSYRPTSLSCDVPSVYRTGCAKSGSTTC